MKTKISIIVASSILLIAITATKAQNTISPQTATSNSQADVAGGEAPKDPVAAVAWYRTADGLTQCISEVDTFVKNNSIIIVAFIVVSVILYKTIGARRRASMASTRSKSSPPSSGT